MKIDMFVVWMIMIALVFAFDGLFTVQKTAWDVSFNAYRADNEPSITGQMALVSEGDITFSAAAKFIAEDIAKDRGIPENNLNVVVLALHKRKTTRYFRPFWRAI